MQRAIEDFSANSPMLTGAAYDSAKGFFTSVLQPLAQGGILLSEAVMEACQKFPEEYIAQVDSGDLRESDLREKIAQVDRLTSELAEMNDRLHGMLFQQQQEGALDGSIASKMSSNQSLMATYQTARRKLQEKLDDLLSFNERSPAIFSEISTLEEAVSKGGKLAKGSWDSSLSQFRMPKSENMEWAATIKKRWESYVERQTIEDELEIKQIQLPSGEIIYTVYKNGELDKDATNELTVELAKEDSKSFKAFIAGAGYQVLENNGVKALLESVFGEREVNDSLKQNKGYNKGVFVGDLFSLVQSGAEFIGGTLWFIGGSGGSLALAPVTGGASAGAIPAVSASTLAIWAHATAVGGMSIQNIISGGNYDNSSNAVGNMDDFFEGEFGSELKGNLSKNGKRVDGQQVYKVDNKKLKELGLKKETNYI
ncbi:hypothetical protein [uncultured Vagococcus sp.]|uniref:hypothetical protein n=1 Tax=uncultured Vagococcus sp. TaxID=189676 RepID=UPI0028D6BCB4|nr:hypothetical protein [uncultured Vagococcus sp.]